MSQDPELKILEIAVSDFDVSGLPESARQPGTPSFEKAVRQFYEERLGRVVESYTVKVEGGKIRVSWRVKDLRPNAVDEAISALQAGDYDSGILMLELLAPSRQDDEVVHFNLGMAYSDRGKLPEAVKHLKQALRTEPRLTNAKVALGVAYSRLQQWEEAVEVLTEAAKEEPNNPWALRNLGGALLRLGTHTDVALTCLKQATVLLPEDQSAWYGLAQAQMESGASDDADESLQRVLAIQPFSKIAELAKELRSRIAAKTFREIGGEVRPDAVLYCLGALKTFKDMIPEQVQQIGFEIAILGMKGINVNDSASAYQLRSLPGTFTGLHLLCLQYVAFQQIDPSMDMGFDVSREYAEAKMLMGSDT